MTKEGFILSCRCMCDFAIFAFRSITTKQSFIFEFSRNDEKKIEHRQKLTQIRQLMEDELIVGWGNHTYDLPILHELLENKSIIDIYSQHKILKYASYKKQAVETQDKTINYLDLALFTGQTSDNHRLNLFAARLHTKIIFNEFTQNPLYTRDYERELLKQEIQIRNNQIHEIFNHLLLQINDRKILGEEYNLDLLSQSSSRAVESVFKEYFTKNEELKPPSKPPHVKYKKPPLICFKTDFLQKIPPFLESLNFEINKQEGNIRCPASFLKYKVRINNSFYSLSLGGLHSNEQKTYVLPDDEHRIFLCDVKSYYSSLIVQLGICPDIFKESARLIKKFTEFYKNLIIKKNIAEKRRHKTAASITKLLLNSVYGKLSQPSSILHSPQAGLNISLTGQLTLLMLIEHFELNNIRVISANTDGVIVKLHKYYIKDFENVCLAWEDKNSLKLKKTELTGVFFKNVNNYFAKTIDGEMIRRGMFGKSHMHKAPAGEICFKAIFNYLIDNIPISQTVRDFKNIKDYLFCRIVTGGCYACSIESPYTEKYIGQVARWIYCDLGYNQILRYRDGGKVAGASGVYEASNLDRLSSADIHYERYEEIANNILEDILQKKCG